MRHPPHSRHPRDYHAWSRRQSSSCALVGTRRRASCLQTADINPVRQRQRPFPTSRKGPLNWFFTWWRGQDLNLRPSGYECTHAREAWLAQGVLVQEVAGFAARGRSAVSAGRQP